MFDDSSGNKPGLMIEDNQKTKRKKSSRSKATSSLEPKVKDLIQLLKYCSDVVSNPLFGRETEKLKYLETLKNVLSKHKSMPLTDFIKMLDQLPSINESQINTPVTDLSDEEIQKLSLEEIRLLCREDVKVSKGTLDRVGHERFGVSMSQLKSSSREKSIQLILSALENLDILNSIAEKAKSSSTDYK